MDSAAVFSKRRGMNTGRLETLCNSFGVSSAEHLIANMLRKSYEPLCDEIKCDRLGSLFAIKRSKNPDAATFMIASPLDEVGMMISEVKKEGTLSFIPLEHLACSSLLHQRVRILTRKNTCIDGVIGMDKKMLEDSCEVKNAEDLFIACGLLEEEIKELIHPGDLVGYGSAFSEQDGVLMSKALFPRILNEVTLELLERVKDTEFDFHLAVGCIAQSVIGFRGTKTATYVIRPDAAIALTAFDTAKRKVRTGDGVILGYYDRQMLPSQVFLHDFSEKVAAKAYFGATGNDGSFIHKTLKGTPAISVGIAVDNMGSANETGRTGDVDTLVDSLAAYLGAIDSEKIAAFGLGDVL